MAVALPMAAFGISLMTATLALRLREEQLQAELDEAWAMAFPNGPGRANSTLFDQIARVEQLVIFYNNNIRPSSRSRSSTGENLRLATMAANMLASLEIIRDIRQRREMLEAGGDNNGEGPSSLRAPPYFQHPMPPSEYKDSPTTGFR